MRLRFFYMENNANLESTTLFSIFNPIVGLNLK
jgi:hypothetical protein